MAKKVQKDYMGKISWNRLQCGAPQAMFGSEIKSDSLVCLRISRAYIDEDEQSRTKVGGRICAEFKPMIEIEMTPLQFAELLTAGQAGDGVPCTITRIDGNPTEPVEMRDIAKEYDEYTDETFDEFKKGLIGLEEYVQAVIQSGKPMGKTQMQELVRNLQSVRNKTVEDVKYTKHIFKEDMAKLVVNAKAEVNSYAELRLQGLGVKCLMNDGNQEVKPAEIAKIVDDATIKE